MKQENKQFKKGNQKLFSIKGGMLNSIIKNSSLRSEF